MISTHIKHCSRSNFIEFQKKVTNLSLYPWYQTLLLSELFSLQKENKSKILKLKQQRINKAQNGITFSICNFHRRTPIHKKKNLLWLVFLDPMLKAPCVSSGYCCTPIDMMHGKQSAGNIYEYFPHFALAWNTIPWKIISAQRNQYCNNIKNNNEDVCFW